VLQSLQTENQQTIAKQPSADGDWELDGKAGAAWNVGDYYSKQTSIGKYKMSLQPHEEEQSEAAARRLVPLQSKPASDAHALELRNQVINRSFDQINRLDKDQRIMA